MNKKIIVFMAIIGLLLIGSCNTLSAGGNMGKGIKLPINKSVDVINWSKYTKMGSEQLNTLTSFRGVQVKHDSQLDYLESYYPKEIKRVEQDYMSIKYKPTPTTQQVIEMQSEISKLLTENEGLESLREKEKDSEKQGGLLENIQANVKIMDDLNNIIETQEKKDYYTGTIDRLKEKYASVLIEKEIRTAKAFDRNPIGTTYYIDFINGLDSNNGTGTGSAWQTLRQYTNVTVRTPGDIAYVRAGQEHQYTTADIVFDEDGNRTNYIYLIGCNSTIDPWGDGIDTRTNISFNGTAYQVNPDGDDYWEFQNLVFKNSSDTNGMFLIQNCYNVNINNCVFRDANGANVEGYYQLNGMVHLNNFEVYNIQGTGLYLSSGAGGQTYLIDGQINTGTAGTTLGISATCVFVYIKNVNMTGGDTDIAGNVAALIYADNLLLNSTAEFGVFKVGLIKIGDKDLIVGNNLNMQYSGSVSNDNVNIKGGGANSSARMLPVSYADISNPLTLIGNIKGDFQIWTPASETNVSIYIQGYNWTTKPNSSQLWVEAEYLNTPTGSSRSVVRSTQSITDNSTWVGFNTTFTPSQEGWAYITVKLGLYEDATTGIFVDIKPVVNGI